MENRSLEQIVTKMREYIVRDVAAGFASADEICNSVVEIFSDEQDSSVLFPYAYNIVQETIEAHIKEQANWEEITDCDRLDQAFDDLEHHNIISRQNFSCCGTCGAGEILDEMRKAQENGQNVRGYTFYHAQDCEYAIERQGIHLSYGSIDEENDIADINIGHEIVRIINITAQG